MAGGSTGELDSDRGSEELAEEELDNLWTSGSHGCAQGGDAPERHTAGGLGLLLAPGNPGRRPEAGGKKRWALFFLLDVRHVTPLSVSFGRLLGALDAVLAALKPISGAPCDVAGIEAR